MADAVRPALGPATGRWVLVATILGSSMVFIEGSTVNVALPALQASLDASVVDAQWVVNAYMLFLASLLLLGGSLGDRFGRRRLFVVGTVLFSLASVACGLARDPDQLVAARAVQGVGGALLTPGSLAILNVHFRGAARGQAIGLWSGASALTTALGPLLGGWLIDTLSWRWVFFMIVPLGAATVAISLARVPESRDEAPAGRLDWPGAALATGGLGGLTFGLIEGQERGFDAPLVLAALAVGVGLLAGFVERERRARTPMMPLRLFRSSTFAGANVLTLLLYAAFSGALFFLPFNLIQVQGYSATAAGAAFLPTILLLALLSRAMGGLAVRTGARLLLVVGPLVCSVAFALLALPGVGGSYWTTFFPGLVVLGLGMAISVAPLTTTVMGAVPMQLSGVASGINNAVSRVAGLLAVAAFGIVALALFGPALDARLTGLELPPEARARIEAARSDLAGLQPPEGLDEERARRVEEAVDAAFVRGFRGVAGAAAALAALGAGAAFAMIRDEEIEDPEAASGG